MDQSSSSRGVHPEAQRLFDEFVAAGEEGSPRLPEDLLAEHPQHAGDLQKLLAEWQDFQQFAHEIQVDFAVDSRAPATDPGPASRHLERLQKSGSREGRYQLRGELGRGGMGQVLRVYDDQVRRELAMKVLRDRPEAPGASPSASTVERFLAEAQITGQLDHPGVVPLHEIGVDELGRPFFTMAMVRGRNLGVVMKLAQKGAEGWTEARVVGVLLKVCETLAYAHSKGVVHRDIKPANIMVGRLGEVYVMDWGLAKSGWKAREAAQDAESESAEIKTLRDLDSSDSFAALETLDGAVLGTPSYMSPEQAAGRIREVGPRSDVYSVGAMLYELLAATPPYLRELGTPSPRELLHTLCRQPPAPIRQLARGAPAELIAICEKAMAREPSNRYAGMEAMAEDLRAHFEGRVVQSYETGALAEFRKWFRRNRGAGLSLAAALVVVLLSLTWVLLVQWRANRELERSREAADREAQILASVLEWTEGMFETAAPDQARGRTVSAREIIDRAAADFAREVDGDPAVRARLAASLGSLYAHLGVHTEAARLLSLAAQASADAHQSTDPQNIQVRSLLVISWSALNQVDRAEQELNQLLAELPLLDLASRVSVLNTRGAFLRDRQQLDAAEAAWKQAQAEAAGLPPSHSLALSVANNLGVLFHQRGDYAAAEEQFVAILARRRADLGDDHPDTLISMGNLATVYRDQARNEEARALFDRTIATSRAVLGDDHPETLKRIRQLSLLLEYMGDFAAAAKLSEEAYGHALRELEPTDRLRIDLGEQWARLLGNQGRWQEARSLLADSLVIQRQILPEGDPGLVSTLRDLGNAEFMRGDLDAARTRMNEALQLLRAAPQSEFLQRINVLTYLGRIHLRESERAAEPDLSALARAELLLEEAHQLAVRHLGDANQFTVRATFLLGEVLAAQGKGEAALERLEEALDLAREHLPANNPMRWQALYRYARVLHASHYPEDALDLMDELVEDVSPGYHDFALFQQFRAELQGIVEQG